MKKILVWFRNDLRNGDNPALIEAAQGGEIVPVFTWAPEEEGEWPPGEGSCRWLYHSLTAFQKEWKGNLVVRKGPSLSTLADLLKETQAEALYFNRTYEPALLERDVKIYEEFTQQGIEVKTFNGNLLCDPNEVETKAGKPFQVFTPFWNTARKLGPFLPAASHPIRIVKNLPKSLSIDDLSLPADPILTWEPGEKGGWKRLEEFVEKELSDYLDKRDRPDLDGVSRLSPHLHFGEISPRQIWEKVEKTKKGEGFIRQLFWREFAHHLLFHFPQTPEKPLREEFALFPWDKSPKALQAWKEGKTGYPIVDAGMRQLEKMGWMHNRVRMIVASFLTKDLLIPWQEGARHFWEKLIDADLANNTLGWQWTAGCGADAAPYFRIFNPTTQSEKFDPEGDYIRTFVPELRKLPAKLIHNPSDALPMELAEAGIILGKTYPYPILEHKKAREKALSLYQEMKKT